MLYTLVLSQPAGRGEGGIWCVERWYDNNGSIYYEFPYESGEAAADYFDALQKAADSGGDTTLCDPVMAALAFARNRLGHASATEESFLHLEGGVAGNVWRLCHRVFDGMGTLQASTLDPAGNSTDREALPVPEQLTRFNKYVYTRLYHNIWLKAEKPVAITGGVVICRNSGGTEALFFYQQDRLLCISADGTEQWFSPAYDFAISPYESMRRIYEDFHRYYYPEPLHRLEDITFDDQEQVEALITAYFGALEQKDYTAAWELMSSGRQGKGYPPEPSVSEGGRIGDIKLVSMEGYLPPYIAQTLPPYEFKMADVPEGTPTVWFWVKLDVRSEAGAGWENGINERFVNVAKEADGTWRIDSLATGP